MDVSGISQTLASEQTSQSTDETNTNDNGTIGKDGFLQLLVTQMRNQDPMNPMKGKEMASQLAQFNSVEQLINVNDGLGKLQNSQELMRMEMTNSMASSLAGKDVRALSDKVQLTNGENTNINYDLDNAASEVEIVIRDAAGSEVRRETISGATAGEHNWIWDGQTNNGENVVGGQYSVEINASNGDESVEADTLIEGTADKVRFTGEGVRISIDGVEVPIGDIESVSENDK